MLQKSHADKLVWTAVLLGGALSPPLGLIISKKVLFPPWRQSKVSIHSSSLQNKNSLSSHLYFDSAVSYFCVCIGVCCFLYLITMFMLLERLKAGSCLVISNLYISVIGHFKEQTVWFKRPANSNGLPRAGAMSKSTTIQRNTKAKRGGGRLWGNIDSWTQLHCV